ncbi:MAG: hypothetical protein IPI67_37295 [Myxococcales bacterium]|nr:hypothetical protein [Myxococcales bacterium]
MTGSGRRVQDRITKGVVAASDVVLIAVNQGGILDSGLHDVEVPAIVKTVFPIGEPVMVVTPYGTEPPRVEVPPRFAVVKKKGGRGVDDALPGAALGRDLGSVSSGLTEHQSHRDHRGPGPATSVASRRVIRAHVQH